MRSCVCELRQASDLEGSESGPDGADVIAIPSSLKMDWPHNIHPCEEHMLLYGEPEIRTDVMEAGLTPIYELDDDCYAWTVMNGCLQTALSSYSRSGEDSRHFVWTGSQTKDKVTSELVRAGCTLIQLVNVKRSGDWGGLGFKPKNPHFNCKECIVMATMQV